MNTQQLLDRVADRSAAALLAELHARLEALEAGAGASAPVTPQKQSKPKSAPSVPIHPLNP